MDTVGKVDMDLLASRRSIHHLIHRRGAEVLAGVAEFLHTAMVANIRIADDQVHRLVIFVTRA